MRRYFYISYNELLKYRYLILKFLLFVLLFSVCNTFLVESYRVKGDSMFPSIKSGDVLIINKMTNDFNREDLIIFIKNGEVYIKRIWGIPGDSILLNDESRLILNNSTFLYQFDEVVSKRNFNVRVSDNLYFVLGDNINNSVDSRTFGLVHESEIIGKVSLRYFPIYKLKHY